MKILEKIKCGDAMLFEDISCKWSGGSTCLRARASWRRRWPSKDWLLSRSRRRQRFDDDGDVDGNDDGHGDDGHGPRQLSSIIEK